MELDRDGFRIPPRFEPVPDDPGAFGPRSGRAVPVPAADSFEGLRSGTRPPALPRGGAGRTKRGVVLGCLAALFLGTVGIPVLWPAVREAVVDWSLAGVDEAQARGDAAAALGHVDRALDWAGDDHRLLCLRGQLRMENGDAAGALVDVDRACALVPTAPQPLRLRALVNTILGRPDEALADAQAVVDLSTPGDPESLNLRAYTRALLRRDLPEALADIERSLARGGEESPEHLDTRGFILHLLGRNAEAIDDLNRAIDGMQESRKRLTPLAGRVDGAELARRLRSIDQSLAVMHHHRGEACAAAGFARQAEQDLDVAKRKGYDPSRGIF